MPPHGLRIPFDSNVHEGAVLGIAAPVTSSLFGFADDVTRHEPSPIELAKSLLGLI
jgi:hypothetical protein